MNPCSRPVTVSSSTCATISKTTVRGETPPREHLEEDGDVFAGNLVTIDHGNGEYTLTCHLLPGSVTVAVGDQVTAGQVIGKVGKAGLVHFNMMNDGEWLEAHGVPCALQ